MSDKGRAAAQLHGAYEERPFESQRYSYLGSIDDWINIGDIDGLTELVETYVPHLDEDSLYDLY